MKPGTIEGATRTLGAPLAWDARNVGECVPLPIRDDVDGFMSSAWYPTTDELHAMIAGAPIILDVFGRAHPPVCLRVQSMLDLLEGRKA